MSSNGCGVLRAQEGVHILQLRNCDVFAVGFAHGSCSPTRLLTAVVLPDRAKHARKRDMVSPVSRILESHSQSAFNILSRNARDCSRNESGFPTALEILKLVSHLASRTCS